MPTPNHALAPPNDNNTQYAMKECQVVNFPKRKSNLTSQGVKKGKNTTRAEQTQVKTYNAGLDKFIDLNSFNLLSIPDHNSNNNNNRNINSISNYNNSSPMGIKFSKKKKKKGKCMKGPMDPASLKGMLMKSPLRSTHYLQ